MNLCDELYNIKNSISNLALPFWVGEYCEAGFRRVSDNTLYICIKAHQASPEIFIGNPEYWVPDFGGLVSNKEFDSNNESVIEEKSTTKDISVVDNNIPALRDVTPKKNIIQKISKKLKG